MRSGRVLIDSGGGGAWNMAVDQVLMESAAARDQITLRFYRWTEPTLSLGYFQKSESRQAHPESRECALVRRHTGGGAILHHHDLTYSLSIPNRHRWSRKSQELYDTVHRIVIADLASQGITASLFAETGQPTGENGAETPAESMVDPENGALPEVEPNAFLCFQRRSPGDVVLGGFKILGSAQRRSRNALLQHGSILLGRSRFAPQLPGIEDLLTCRLDVERTVGNLVNGLSECLQIRLEPDKLSPSESKSANLLQVSVFASAEWNFKR